LGVGTAWYISKYEGLLGAIDHGREKTRELPYEKPEDKRPLEVTSGIRENIIKIDPKRLTRESV
jgi:hypothetical protein